MNVAGEVVDGLGVSGDATGEFDDDRDAARELGAPN